MKGCLNMKITIVEKNISQQGANLVNEFDSYYDMETDEFKHEKDSFESATTIINRFRKNDISYSPYGFNSFELYLNGELIATIDPCFTVDNETYLNWYDCFDYANDDNFSLSDVNKITKRLSVISYTKMIDILDSEYEETFSE